MSKMRVEFNARVLGPFARPADARDVAAQLVARGWPITLIGEERRPRWSFATRDQYRRFGRDLERILDAPERRCGFSVEWACSCQDGDRCTCENEEATPAPLDESSSDEDDVGHALLELYGEALEGVVETFYPGLRAWIDLNIGSLYGALAFGLRWEKALGSPAAAGMWLGQHWPAEKGKLRTYDECLDDFAQLLDFASHDAWMSEELARARVKLEDVTFCETCHEVVGLYCHGHEEEA